MAQVIVHGDFAPEAMEFLAVLFEQPFRGRLRLWSRSREIDDTLRDGRWKRRRRHNGGIRELGRVKEFTKMEMQKPECE